MNQNLRQRTIIKRINWPAIIKIQGILLIMLAAFMIVPLAVSIRNQGPDLLAFAISAASAALAGGGLIFIARRHHPAGFGKREGFLLTATIWIVLSVFGMLPFMIGKPQLSLSDAFFESMSGFTTTGASTISDFSMFSPAMHLWRCMMQWLGGMGIVIFTIALLPMLNTSGGLQMFNAEATGFSQDKISPRVSSTAKRLWFLYILLTAVCAVLLSVGGMSVFDSICHAMSTLSSGGFSTSPEGIAGWHSQFINVVVLVFMWVSGINFVVLWRLSHGHFRQAWRDDMLRAYTITILIVAAIFGIAGLVNSSCENPLDYIIYPLFNTVSTISSTGYDIGDIASWSPVILPLMLLLMIIGGCAGSTSGGAKIDRMLIVWKNCRNETRRSVHANRFYPLKINGRSAGVDVMYKVAAFLAFYIFLIILGGIVLIITGMNSGDAFLSALACIGNTASASQSVAESFTTMTDGAKWFLSLLMMVGRLEIFTVLVLFTATFWRRS